MTVARSTKIAPPPPRFVVSKCVWCGHTMRTLRAERPKDCPACKSDPKHKARAENAMEPQ